MGTTVRMYLFGGPDELETSLRQRLGELEQRWSRFIEDSDISRLNRASGRPTPVSPDTILLVERALDASKRTRGWFDPTLLRQLVDAGYDRSFVELGEGRLADLVVTIDRQTPEPVVNVHEWNSTARAISIDAANGTVSIPSSIGFDPGGIGKGLAADLLAKQSVAAGTTAALIDLGGDIVATGQPPDGGWLIGIEDPFDRSATIASVRIPWGAVATSSRANRRWVIDNEERHHLIDPGTGEPSTTDVAACTVIGGACWLAESFAKAALLAGLDVGLDMVAEAGLEALMVDTAGGLHRTPGMNGFLT